MNKIQTNGNTTLCKAQLNNTNQNKIKCFVLMGNEFRVISCLVPCFTAKSILNIDSHLVREFRIIFTSYLCSATFCNEGLTLKLLFKMYTVVSGTIACCIHKAHGEDRYISIDELPHSMNCQRNKTLMNCSDICDRGKLYNTGTRKRKLIRRRINY